ncbi:MAG TPA: imidazolonepropionase [Roseiflexaceae bacterium]|nr:imidazolonepropionase [Roseiflexaceae bacterium]
MHVDVLIHSATQLVTCASPGGPRRGPAMREVGLIGDGALAVAGGTIVAVGRSADLRARFTADQEIDASGRAVCPGFVDPHTHMVYCGDRIGEFERRIAGATYQQIAAEGGGILATVRATRAASVERLAEETRPRLAAMLRLGTTTAEAKTGYGLEMAAELRQLAAIAALDAAQPVELVPTFLAAHAVPPEHRARPDDYVALVVEEMLPAAAAWHRASRFAQDGRPMFVDVFCEQGAFDLAQARRVLEAARALGLPLKAHVDEFSALGGLRMALELGAVSVDHLDVTAAEDIPLLARSPAVAVVIPTVTFNLGGTHFADARAMVDAGAALALTTDINPGSSPCPSMQLAAAIACRYQRLLPAEALTACTINAAHAIGMGARTGSLEAGKQADILLLDAPDYRHFAYTFGGNVVGTVIKRGRVVATGDRVTN